MYTNWWWWWTRIEFTHCTLKISQTQIMYNELISIEKDGSMREIVECLHFVFLALFFVKWKRIIQALISMDIMDECEKRENKKTHGKSISLVWCHSIEYSILVIEMHFTKLFLKKNLENFDDCFQLKLIDKVHSILSLSQSNLLKGRSLVIGY